MRPAVFEQHAHCERPDGVCVCPASPPIAEGGEHEQKRPVLSSGTLRCKMLVSCKVFLCIRAPSTSRLQPLPDWYVPVTPCLVLGTL